MTGTRKASLEFDARCYALRYDELLTIAEIAEQIHASPETVRKGIRRHAATIGEPVEREMFGSHLRHLDETAAAARALDRGENPDDVFARTSFANKNSMLRNVQRYRKRTRKKAPVRPPQTKGTALIHTAKRATQVSLNVRALRPTGWCLGDVIEWRAAKDTIVLSKRDPAADRPTRGRGGVVTVAAATPSDPRLLRVTISVTRLGWKPGRAVQWEWDATRDRMIVQLQPKTSGQLPDASSGANA